MKKQLSFSLKTAFMLYSLSWHAALPFLKKNKRLIDGFEDRTLSSDSHSKADLWIQAASAGEAYLAEEILKQLSPLPAKILLTSTTRQGIDILNNAAALYNSQKKFDGIKTAFFPFDRPQIMAKAVEKVNPALTVFLESEIWPGLMLNLKTNNIPFIILNGRITEKSVSRYMTCPALWRTLKPDHILAISEDDASRFRNLFDLESVRTAFNIKFDRIDFSSEKRQTESEPFPEILSPESAFIVLGSVREEEEHHIDAVITDILENRHDAVIGLFPRHMHRIPAWRTRLEKNGIRYSLRSEIKEAAPLRSIILWDKFGELSNAYMKADAAFVGGSLAPLGGQNFLEPLTFGIKPVIGPSWDNFKWVGNEIFENGLVRICESSEAVSGCLLTDLLKNTGKTAVISDARNYFLKRRGGTAASCRLIERYIGKNTSEFRIQPKTLHLKR